MKPRSMLTPFGTSDLPAGGSSGIGVETARALSSQGAHTVLAVRNTEAGQATKADILKGSPKAQVRNSCPCVSSQWFDLRLTKIVFNRYSQERVQSC